MTLFGRKHYDRNRIMADAVRAVKANKPKRAAALYGEVLAAEPNNCEIHRKIAPLLGQTGQAAAAWQSYKHSVEALVRNKQLDEAVSVLHEASEYSPRQAGVWATLASVEHSRGRTPQALKALMDGRALLTRRKDLAGAVLLLERARKLRPDDFDIGFDLAHSLARLGKRKQAHGLLERLAGQAPDGTQLRRVRARQFRLRPTPLAAWRWLRATPGRVVQAPRTV